MSREVDDLKKKHDNLLDSLDRIKQEVRAMETFKRKLCNIEERYCPTCGAYRLIYSFGAAEDRKHRCLACLALLAVTEVAPD